MVALSSAAIAVLVSSVTILVCDPGVSFQWVLVAGVLALVAAAIGGRNARLAAFAVGAGAVCFALGMTLAILTGHPLY